MCKTTASVSDTVSEDVSGEDRITSRFTLFVPTMVSSLLRDLSSGFCPPVPLLGGLSSGTSPGPLSGPPIPSRDRPRRVYITFISHRRSRCLPYDINLSLLESTSEFGRFETFDSFRRW